VSDVLCYDAYDGALFCPLSFGPGRRQDIGDLVVGHVGQTTQHVAKVSQRIYVNSFLKRILQQEGDRTGIAGGYFRIESSTPNFFTKPVLESARAYCVNPFLKTKVAAPCSSVQLHAVTPQFPVVSSSVSQKSRAIVCPCKSVNQFLKENWRALASADVA
jgi:hypothetical protein